MKYAYLYGGAIGDSLVGLHLGRALHERLPGSHLILISTRRSPFVRELAETLPYVHYQELIKEDPRTWWFFMLLAITPSSIFVFEPTDVSVPRWWKLILRVATVLPGSKEVHSQLIGHERAVRARVVTSIVGPEDNLFMVNVPRTLRAWAVDPGDALTPFLPRPKCKTPEKPNILFHFFAASYRRSYPVDKARSVLEHARTLFPTYEIILSATPDERERAEAMAKGIPDIRIETELSASELLCYLQNATVVVGVASGVTHLASHLGKPVIALSNLSDPYWLPTYAPKTIILANREHCRCKGNKQGDCVEDTPDGEVFRCLYYISTESILEAMQATHAL